MFSFMLTIFTRVYLTGYLYYYVICTSLIRVIRRIPSVFVSTKRVRICLWVKRLSDVSAMMCSCLASCLLFLCASFLPCHLHRSVRCWRAGIICSVTRVTCVITGAIFTGVVCSIIWVIRRIPCRFHVANCFFCVLFSESIDLILCSMPMFLLDTPKRIFTKMEMRMEIVQSGDTHRCKDDGEKLSRSLPFRQLLW